ncbi:MAG: hypothetical protein IPP72_13570 [Chitinophagaceae bacterium]|nr:hypothetical protein [Chitinophagaceae bacterium]
MKKYFLPLLLAVCSSGFAQNVGIGTSTPHANALLELSSSNKGLLLPRVSDTNAITGAKPAGLTIYSNTDKSLYFYNGTNWQKSAASGDANSLWYLKNDSILFTDRKYIGINADANFKKPVKGLNIYDGGLLIEPAYVYTNTAPTPSQTFTMNNTGIIQSPLTDDSVTRVFDPGGANNNYNNNMQGNLFVTCPINVLTSKISFNTNDFGLGTGDTLWISRDGYPACRTDYHFRIAGSTIAPDDLYINQNFFVTFRSNADGANGKGFDITIKKIYLSPGPSQEYNLAAGMGFYFNPGNGALRAGIAGNGKIGINSIAMGNTAVASGLSAVALGASAVALGTVSTAIGFETIASGNFSTSLGYKSLSPGAYSFSAGIGTNAYAFGSTALGYYNNPIAGSNSTNYIETDPLLYVGNGNSSFPENALVVYKNADIDINGYSRLGPVAEGAPAIKMKELSGTTSNTNNGNVSITHGLNSAKIISVQALVEYSAGNFVPTAYTYAQELHFNYLVQTNSILIVNNASTCAGTSICNKPVKILITYKE